MFTVVVSRSRPVSRAFALLSASLCAIGVSMAQGSNPSTITSAPFGKTPAGAPVEIYTLHNARGMEAKIMTYGGIVTRLTAPDRKGQFADVVLGHDTLAA